MAWFINNAAKEYCISSFSQKTRNNIDNLTFGSYNVDMVYNSERVLLTIAEKLKSSGKQFMRAAFVGARGKAKNNLRKCLNGGGFAVDFFGGIEAAKQWLIGR